MRIRWLHVTDKRSVRVQRGVMHSSADLPTHGLPVPTGLGLLQVRVWVPLPQVTLHDDHEDQPPSTAYQGEGRETFMYDQLLGEYEYMMWFM